MNSDKFKKLPSNEDRQVVIYEKTKGNGEKLKKFIEEISGLTGFSLIIILLAISSIYIGIDNAETNAKLLLVSEQEITIEGVNRVIDESDVPADDLEDFIDAKYNEFGNSFDNLRTIKMMKAGIYDSHDLMKFLKENANKSIKEILVEASVVSE